MTSRPKRKSTGDHNFHLPLPDALYLQLRREAARTQRPATAVARDALAHWLQERERAALHESIAAYAQAMAGTPHDLDPELEAAGVELVMVDAETAP